MQRNEHRFGEEKKKQIFLSVYHFKKAVHTFMPILDMYTVH